MTGIDRAAVTIYYQCPHCEYISVVVSSKAGVRCGNWRYCGKWLWFLGNKVSKADYEAAYWINKKQNNEKGDA